MILSRALKKFRTTADSRKASVVAMPLVGLPGAVWRSGSPQWTIAGKVLMVKYRLQLPVILLTLIPFFLMSQAMALAAQSGTTNAPLSQPSETSAASSFISSLQPALESVKTSINQLQIDHWKISNEWKSQLHRDADSIRQDLSQQLPDLMQQVQTNPTALDAQMRVMQNVNALYDVLVRLTIAANLTDRKKMDAAVLTNTLQRLDSARKAASAQLLRNVSLQKQQIEDLKSKLITEKPAAQQPKTIIVDNRTDRPAPHRKTRHKKSPQSPPKSQPQK